MVPQHKYDAIIMGAGSTGSSIAFNLAKKGYTNVLVVDRSCAGCGQTSRSSALIRLHYTNDVIRDMAVYSWRFWKDRFQDETGCEYSIFTKIGIGFAGPEEGRVAMEKVVNDLKRRNIDVELYDAEEFKKEVFGYIDTDGISVVAWEPDSGYGDPNTVVQSFLNFARKEGIEVLEYTPIRSLIREENMIVGIKTDKGVFKADYFIDALGVWANDLLKPVGAELPIEIGLEEVLFLKNPPNRKAVPPGWADLTLGFYSRPEGSSYTLVGGLGAEYRDIPPEPGEYSSPPVDVVVKRSEPFTKRFPGMTEASPYSVWIGFFDITPDWQPIIGFDLRIENLIHMVGLSGHGFKLAPAYGDVMSDIVIYGEAKNFDVSGFSLERFTKEEGRHSAYKYGIIG